ncbi:hypothetical protein FBQ81_03435 [Chloroflexi bacterium CFX6]|nr:hypothetical protein [Chloroflexi bacterium CFX6]
MSKVTKEKAKYVNIPVLPEVYADAQLVAQAKGFGRRGLGALVAHWVGMELPECDHEKEPVEIEWFPSNDILPGTLIKRTGYFCAICNRVYAKATEADLVKEDGKRLSKAVRVKQEGEA